MKRYAVAMKRFDMADVLAHFTRDRDGFTGFSALCKIARDGALIAGWSERNRRRTVYGDAPAVCFTEMPLRALVEYVDGRGDRGRVSPHAVFLRKDEAFAQGARPAIYGWTGPAPAAEGEGGARTLSGVPVTEQYRFVAYNPNRARTLDWTHEREWRWRCPPGEEHEERWRVTVESDWRTVPGLSIFPLGAEAPPFSEVKFMVETATEAEELLDVLRTRADVSAAELEVLDAVIIVVYEDLKREFAKGLYDARDLPPELYVYNTPTAPSEDELSRVREALARARAAALAASAAFAANHAVFMDRDCSAFVNVVATQPRHPMLRALIEIGAAEPWGEDGVYKINTISLCQWSDRALFQEAAAEAAVKSLIADLGIECRVQTRLD